MANRIGFLAFIRNVGVTAAQVPNASADIDNALAMALEIVLTDIQSASPLMYDQAVYNLAFSIMLEIGTDQPGQTFFLDQRKNYDLNGFVPGVIASTSDEGTSESLVNPDFMKNLQLSDLQYLKNPWGRQYLAIAQRFGPIWGMS